jgi:hypothetical protein
MSIHAFIVFKIFFAINCIGGFLLMIFGAGLIESPDTVTMLIGVMVTIIGILSFITFGILLAQRAE